MSISPNLGEKLAQIRQFWQNERAKNYQDSGMTLLEPSARQKGALNQNFFGGDFCQKGALNWCALNRVYEVLIILLEIETSRLS